jgi:hypothetical protein
MSSPVDAVRLGTIFTAVMQILSAPEKLAALEWWPL